MTQIYPASKSRWRRKDLKTGSLISEHSVSPTAADTAVTGTALCGPSLVVHITSHWAAAEWPTCYNVTQCCKTISSSEFSKDPNLSLLIWWLKHQLAASCTARNRTWFCIRRNIQSGGEHQDQPWKICVIGLNWTFSFTLTTATIIQANTVIKWHKLVSYLSQFWFWGHNIQLSNSWIKAAEGSLIALAESVLQRWQQLDS